MSRSGRRNLTIGKYLMLIKYYRYFVSQVCVHYDTISLHSQQSPIIARQKLCADTDTWQQHGETSWERKNSTCYPSRLWGWSGWSW